MESNGTVTYDQTKILDVQAKYYEKLYRKDENVTCNLKINTPPKQISDCTRVKLDEKITMKEIETALKSMAKNKSPGDDGFGPSFYVVFWNRIKNLVFDAFQEALECGTLHSTARQGVITLIPRSGRDLKNVKHWRPIMLLNTDYKILSKVIANRIKQTLDTIIHPDQNGFQQGRSLTMNLRKILDVMDLCETTKIPALLISIDFEKAFDCVNHQALFKILSWFNFGEEITKYIKVLYDKISLCTINNGYTSPRFNLNKGLLQGNPVASILFFITIEALAIHL